MTDQPGHIVITGANRGIGLEFCRQYLAEHNRVTAVVRTSDISPGLKALKEAYTAQLDILFADVSDQKQVANLRKQLKGETINLLINNAGIYGKRVGLGELDNELWLKVMAVNAIAPLMVTQTLVDLIPAGGKVLIISSKMGSIAENTSGGSYIYRSAKAAVNASGRSLALDLAGHRIAVALCHPGWVRTDMGGPNGLIDPDESVTGLRAVAGKLTLASSGQFFNYDGSIIPW